MYRLDLLYYDQKLRLLIILSTVSDRHYTKKSNLQIKK